MLVDAAAGRLGVVREREDTSDGVWQQTNGQHRQRTAQIATSWTSYVARGANEWPSGLRSSELESEPGVYTRRIDVRFSPENGHHEANVRFQPADVRSRTESRHRSDGRRRPLMTLPGH